MFQEFVSIPVAILIETAIFIALQISVIWLYISGFPEIKIQKWIYWIIAESLTIITIGFWGFFIIGQPIWKYLF